MTARVTALTALGILLVASMAGNARADCPRWIDAGPDGVGYMLDDPIWWQNPDHVIVDAEAFEVVDGLWFIVEVEHGPGAPAVPTTIMDMVLAHQLLAIAIYSPGHDGSENFLVLTAGPEWVGVAYGEPELPGMITIFYEDTGDCRQDGEYVMPMLGPIPQDCPAEAWVYSMARGETLADAAQAVADSYIAAAD